MLTTCPECNLPVSDKAQTCPHCGYPLQKDSVKKPPLGKSHMRLPNGFGQISELKGRRLRKPFRAMVTVGKTETGRPICKVLSYHETYNDAYMALSEYNRNPYDLDKSMSIAELYDKWTDVYFENITDSSTRTIKAAWAYCGSVYSIKAKDIRVRHIKGCIDTADSPNIKNRIKSLFNLMLDFAVEYEIVDKNYARDFKTERTEPETTHNSFTQEEMDTLWKNISTPYVNYILIQCYMGWRPQELCLIKRKDVDLNAMTVTGGLKTDAGRNRTVPVHSRIQPLLKKIYDMSEMLGSDYLCPSLDGTPLTYDKYNKRFHKTMGDISLGGERNERANYIVHRPHDPRKQFITMCKNANVDEYAIKRMCGHAIDDITEALYTDRSIDWLRAEIEKIP